MHDGVQRVESGGVRLWTATRGTGCPVLLCSGGPGCADYLEPVAAMIDDLAQVIRFEQRGCGRSDASSSYTIADCLIDLEAIRQRYNLERWIVGGHLWGADLALFYALEHPERVLGLICIAGGRVHNDREWHAEYHRRKDTEGELLPEMDYPPNMEVNRQINQDWKRWIQRPSLLRDLSRLTVPALFLYGSRDIRPAWAVQQVAMLMPNARFELIDGAAHVIWAIHADAQARLLREFIRPLASG
jgi:proline iminopeptidase